MGEEGLNEIANIISELERQRAAIDNALSALREVSGAAGFGAGGQVVRRRGRPRKDGGVSAPSQKKGGLTPEGRKRLAESMRRRWATRKDEMTALITRGKKKAR